MGRLLDIARAVPNVRCVPTPQLKQIQRTDQESVPHFEESKSLDSAVSAKSAKTAETSFNQAASLVLNILISEKVPMTHMAILDRFKASGISKLKARQGIAYCQKYGWIEHNLITGYLVPGETGQSED